MKRIMIGSLLVLLRAVLNLFYSILKVFPVKEKKVVFCSRQSNEIPLDFILLQNSLKEKDEEIRCINMCRHIGYNFFDYLKFSAVMLKSMYHLATSRVCVLDSYWPPVSLLKHKEELRVIQIWHAIGKIKQSGLQSVGKKSGRKAEYADFFNMHKNYDYIIAGSKSWNKFYCQSFGTTEDKILNYGLPRIDYLIQNEKKNRDKFFAEYPQACGKKVVLYAPTFRRNMESRWFDISKAAGRQNLVIIVKNHPGQHDHYRIDDDNFIYADNWKTLDLLCVCDYLITDYSAIALEAAALNKPTYYWIYDYEEYLSNNGLNIDIKKELGSYAFEDINIIADKISNEKYIYDEYDKYREKYLFNDLVQSTLKICALIISLLGDEIK